MKAGCHGMEGMNKASSLALSSSHLGSQGPGWWAQPPAGPGGTGGGGERWVCPTSQPRP